MVVQHNLPAMNSHRQLGINNSSTSKNLEKLSSGFRVNRAGDDAAGLAISEKMRGQIRGLEMATTNAENGVSLIQTAEGGLNETHAILQRMRELSVQSANGTYADEVDRENIDKEVQALKSEVDRIASSTHYNGIKLLDGSMGGKKVSDGASFTEVFGADLSTSGFSLSTAGVEALGLKAGDTVKATFNSIVGGASGESLMGYSIQIGDKTFLAGNTGGTLTAYVDGKSVEVGTLSVSAAASKEGVVTGLELTVAANGTAEVADFSAIEDAIVAGEKSELIFQIGANGANDQRVGLHVNNMSSANLGSKVASDGNTTGTVSGITVATRDEANDAIDVLDQAINQVSGTRADLGALQNRLEHTINNLGASKENLQAAESSIRDVDMAKEMMEFTKNNILVQASQSMLAQSNQLPQGVLQLLR